MVASSSHPDLSSIPRLLLTVVAKCDPIHKCPIQNLISRKLVVQQFKIASRVNFTSFFYQAAISEISPERKLWMLSGLHPISPGRRGALESKFSSNRSIA